MTFEEYKKDFYKKLSVRTGVPVEVFGMQFSSGSAMIPQVEEQRLLEIYEHSARERLTEEHLNFYVQNTKFTKSFKEWSHIDEAEPNKEGQPRLRAPWPDYMGNTLFHGDIIRLSFKHCWRAVYENGMDVPLKPQIAKGKGQAVKVVHSLADFILWSGDKDAIPKTDDDRRGTIILKEPTPEAATALKELGIEHEQPNDAPRPTVSDVPQVLGIPKSRSDMYDRLRGLGGVHIEQAVVQDERALKVQTSQRVTVYVMVETNCYPEGCGDPDISVSSDKQELINKELINRTSDPDSLTDDQREAYTRDIETLIEEHTIEVKQ